MPKTAAASKATKEPRTIPHGECDVINGYSPNKLTSEKNIDDLQDAMTSPEERTSAETQRSRLSHQEVAGGIASSPFLRGGKGGGGRRTHQCPQTDSRWVQEGKGVL